MCALTFDRRFLYNILEFLRDCVRIVHDPMRQGYRLKAQSVKVSCSFSSRSGIRCRPAIFGVRRAWSHDHEQDRIHWWWSDG